MKLSELSLREYIALDALNGLCGGMQPALVEEIGAGVRGGKFHVAAAFNLADEFLKQSGRYRDEIAEAKQKVEKAELSADLLRSMNNDGQSGARIALEQIWEFLNTGNQTAAMERLHDMNDALDAIAKWPSDLPKSLRSLALEAVI